MRSLSSALSRESGRGTSDQPHPWIRALEVFGVPFLRYAADGSRSYASPSATQLLEGDAAGRAVGRQADQAIARELESGRSALQLSQFSLARELPSSAGLMLAIHLVRPALADVSAVVVLRPQPATSSGDQRLRGLSGREAEVARLIAAGFATKEIAFRLGISCHTARHHTERVFAKLGVRSRASVAALVATRMGDSSHGSPRRGAQLCGQPEP